MEYIPYGNITTYKSLALIILIEAVLEMGRNGVPPRNISFRVRYS